MERVSIRAGPAKYTGPCGDLCVESVGPGGPGPLWDPQPPRMFVDWGCGTAVFLLDHGTL